MRCIRRNWHHDVPSACLDCYLQILRLPASEALRINPLVASAGDLGAITDCLTTLIHGTADGSNVEQDARRSLTRAICQLRKAGSPACRAQPVQAKCTRQKAQMRRK